MGIQIRQIEAQIVAQIAQLDAIEQKGVPVVGSSQYAEEYPTIMRTLANARAVKKELKRASSPVLGEKISQLAWRITGLECALGRCKEAKEPLLEQLKDKLIEWKRRNPKYHDKECSEQDLEALGEACSYPSFAKKLLSIPSLRTSFFKWAIRDRNRVEVFIKFPSSALFLRNSLLTGRIGRYGGKPLEIQIQEARLALTLPYFDGSSVRRMNILRPEELITLENSWTTPVKKVLQVFADKNIRAGDVEFVGPHGVIANWNSSLLGKWNPATQSHDLVDLEAEDWLERLPAVLELPRSEVEQLYKTAIPEGSSVLFIKASRHRVSMDVADTHGYLEIAMLSKNGLYRIYTLGKVARHYPVGFLQKALFFANTLEGTIQIPDENAFYSHRQHASIAHLLSEMQTLGLLTKIRHDLVQARLGNMVFQFLSESCAAWPVELVTHISEKEPPNYYLVHALEAEPTDPVLRFLLACVRKLPRCLHYLALWILGLLFGYRRALAVEVKGQKVLKSVASSSFGKEHRLYHPAYLVHQVAEKRLQGTLVHGY